MAFEHFVRPNQTPNFSPPKATQSLACEERAATVVLQWGKGGSGKISTISFSLDVTNYMTKQQHEISDRTTGLGAPSE